MSQIIKILSAAVLACALLPLGAPAQRLIEGRQTLQPLVARAQTIAVASVVSKRSNFVNNTIVTFYELALEQSLLGRPGNRFTIAVPGGEFGNLRTQWPGAPELILNQRLVFFGEWANGGALRPVGLFNGVVPIEADANNRAVVALQGTPQPVADFLAEVRQAISARR